MSKCFGLSCVLVLMTGPLVVDAQAERDLPVTGVKRLLEPAAPWYGYDDLFETEWASDPSASPDGEWIVYLRNGYNQQMDDTEQDLWLLKTDGSWHRPLTTDGNAGSAVWSPDGTQLAYVAEFDEGAQIYLRWMDTGTTYAISRLPEVPYGLRWSPDGTQLAFVMFVPEKAEPLAQLPEYPESTDLAPAFHVTEMVTFRADGIGDLEPGFDHIFVMPATKGTARQLTHGSRNYGSAGFTWAADGKSLYFLANLAENWEFDYAATEVYQLNLETAEYEALGTPRGDKFGLELSPDGEKLAYLATSEAQTSHTPFELFTIPVDGDASAPLKVSAQLDFDLVDFAWDGASSESLLALYSDGGDGVLSRISSDGKKIEAISRDVSGLSLGRPYTEGAFTAAAASERIVFTHASTTRPADLATLDKSGQLRVLTSLNDDAFGDLQMCRIEEFTTPSSHDGKTIEGWIVYPPDFDPTHKYPLILEIHGGPHLDYGPYFSAEIQLMAAAGYIVVYGNPRGSIGYGLDFALEIDKNYPSHDFDDLMSLVDYTIAQGNVAEDQLFVTGGSGGGILTAWIVGHTDRFAAAVAAKPDVLMLSGQLGADAYVYFTQYWAPGMPWEPGVAERLWDLSPLKYIGNVTTPTALLVGYEDHRTPTMEAEMFYSALKLKGVDTALIRVPETGHHIAHHPSHLIAKVAHILGWFERYRQND
jgi:acylaminoacyl-peptidase